MKALACVQMLAVGLGIHMALGAHGPIAELGAVLLAACVGILLVAWWVEDQERQRPGGRL